MYEFMDALKETITEATNVSATENGAIGYATTGKKVLDLNFALSSYRNLPDKRIETDFAEAYAENPVVAMTWLFFSRDVRGGLGERRFFRVAMTYMAQNFPKVVNAVLPLIAEYGRWDDLIVLIDVPKVSKNVISILVAQLKADIKGMKEKQSISLLGKWMPSLNASSKETTRKAEILRAAFGATPRQYRKLLSALRKHIGVVERKMSAGEWEQIKYEAVPSRANLIYNGAFLRNDEIRRRDYLGKLERGETKINASVLFPHDIVSQYCNQRTGKSDPALEGMWKALPNTVKENSNTLVVADGSGSMTMTIGGTKVSALDVANALSIYFAERCGGPFKDKYITFSMRPQYVDLSGSTTLLGKINIARKHNEVADTNIEAVFDMILATAVQNKLSQEDLPTNILVISDMEFNSAARAARGASIGMPLFKALASRYKAHGYKLPRLVFWNVNSRTGTIPVKENEYGVALVSGFSPNVARMVMSGKIDPMDCLLETLSDERYDPVRKALRDVC